MSSDEAHRLLDEWRQVIERLEALRAEPVGEITTQFRAELEAKEAWLAERVRAAGLVPERVEARVGSWSPLPLFAADERDDHEHDDDDDEPRAESPQPHHSGSYEALSLAVDELFKSLGGRRGRKRVRRWLKDPERRKGLDPRGARLLAVALEALNAREHALPLRREFGLSAPPEPKPLPALRLRQPWVPSLIDGLTSAQRTIVNGLKETPTEARRLKVVLDEFAEANSPFSRDALTKAADELLLPRPIPIVESVFGRASEERMLKLTRAARWMPFFPNLLVNGCCQPLRFPVYRLGKVVDAARALLRIPFASGSHLGAFLGEPMLGSVTARASPSLHSFGTGTVSFEAGVKVSSDRRTLAVTTLPPPLSLSTDQLEALCGPAEGVTSLSNQGNQLVVTFDHPVFVQHFARRLSEAGALNRVVEVAHVVEFDGKETPVWVGGLLSAWIESCRTALRERVAAPMRAASERLEVVEGLLRAADHEAVVFRIADLSLSNTEAEWALTNLGAEAFRNHATFSTLDTQSLMPFTPAQAKAIVKAKSLAARRPRLLEEREECRREFERLEDSVRETELSRALLTELDQMLSEVSRS